MPGPERGEPNRKAPVPRLSPEPNRNACPAQAARPPGAARPEHKKPAPRAFPEARVRLASQRFASG